MTVEPLSKSFEERLQEIDAYLDLLDALERQVQAGPPAIGGSAITAQQQKILYSSVYLQLYNLVEATATWCVAAVSHAATTGGQWRPADLSMELRREWIRATARTHTDLNYEHRLNATVDFCDQLLKAEPIIGWSVEIGGGGNWDDKQLEDIATRLGCPIQVSKDAYTKIKYKVRDEKSSLVLVKEFRNKLAYGAMSFTECGENVTATELREIKDRAANYLREVVSHFQGFIDGYNFIIPQRRPGSVPT